MKAPKAFMIVEDQDFNCEDGRSADGDGGTSALDPMLNAMLKDLRKKVSTALERPPYVIFQTYHLSRWPPTIPLRSKS